MGMRALDLDCIGSFHRSLYDLILDFSPGYIGAAFSIIITSHRIASPNPKLPLPNTSSAFRL